MNNSEMKTKLICNANGIVAVHFKDGLPIGDCMIMPDIMDIEVKQNDENSKKVVIVYFMDETSEKAVLSGDDTFSLEQGISICITKKLLGRDTPYGSSIYNKLIKYAVKTMKENEQAAIEFANYLAAKEEKRRKMVAKKKARKEKREKKRIEQQIEIQKEAYLRAMRELSDGKA